MTKIPGMMDAGEIVEMLGVSAPCLRVWRWRGWWPEPDIKVGNKNFWSMELVWKSVPAVAEKSEKVRNKING